MLLSRYNYADICSTSAIRLHSLWHMSFHTHSLEALSELEEFYWELTVFRASPFKKVKVRHDDRLTANFLICSMF